MKKRMKPLKRVLLDYDNTLGKTEGPAFAACCTLVNEVLKSQDVDVVFTPDELMRQFVGKSFRQMVTELGSQHGFALAPDDLNRLVREEENRVIASLSSHMEATDYVNEVLVRVYARFGMAVVSSSALRRVKACLAKAGQACYFADDHVFSAATSLSKPTSKPDPAIYLYALEYLGVSADECITVEDSKSGALAGVAAGIPVVGYVGAYPEDERDHMRHVLIEAGCYVVMDSWEEFEAILDERVAAGEVRKTASV